MCDCPDGILSCLPLHQLLSEAFSRPSIIDFSSRDLTRHGLEFLWLFHANFGSQLNAAGYSPLLFYVATLCLLFHFLICNLSMSSRNNEGEEVTNGRKRAFCDLSKLERLLYPFINSCYDQAALLSFGDHVLFSAEGVQEGDPLSGLLFSLVLRSLTDDLRSSFNVWYLDSVMSGTW